VRCRPLGAIALATLAQRQHDLRAHTLGVCTNGHRVVRDLLLPGAESEQAWLEAVRALATRNLGAPVLAVIDGNLGLSAALKVQWPKFAIQRCASSFLM
jgi:transposase-like protein